jgi:lipopolysaccharide/colanic/teichoic acid biosynthesis glycosyltransferase
MTASIIASAVAVFLAGILRTLATSLVAGEVSGVLAAYLSRRVHKAAAALPPELADDQEAEWLEELAVLKERPLRAVLFTRGLADAARAIAPKPQGQTLPHSSQVLKRMLDVVVAVLGILFLGPALLVVSLALRLDSCGPLFFRQPRVGRNGQIFELLKFRTTFVDAERRKVEPTSWDWGSLFTIADDPRITRVGRFLRRTSLEELPMLVNVLRGEMSLVGPRPLVLDEDLRTRNRQLHLAPGLIGPWQMTGRARVSQREMVELDYRYLADWSLWRDVKIMLHYVPFALWRRGV